MGQNVGVSNVVYGRRHERASQSLDWRCFCVTAGMRQELPILANSTVISKLTSTNGLGSESTESAPQNDSIFVILNI